MNAPQIAHIFWKEYRTQRSIWLGIVLIAVVIQILVWGMMPDNARDPLATLAAIGAILSVFYALASAGVLFAGEREEETYAWLRILPVSKLSLFGGKSLWFAVSWLFALSISLLTAYLPYWGTELSRDKIIQGLAQFASMGGGLALWGVFFSLLCQRVYTSLALGPLALLLTAGLNSYFPGIAYVVYAAVAIGVVVQGRRWIVEENLAIWTGFGWRSRALTLDEALGRAAEVSPAWRFFRRELWLEWRNARWIALGSCLMLTALMYFLVASGAPDAITINWFLLFAVLPLAYGVNTVRGEKYQSRYRFQSNAGASPAAVWTAKHLVWGSLLILTMVVSCGVVSLPWVGQIFSRSRYQLADWAYEQLPVPHALPEFLYERFSASWWPTLWLSTAMAVWMYAVGHVCSLLIKRSVSAALVAVALGAVICVPVAATFLLDVPRAIGILLPAGLLLLFGLWQTRGWLSERNETRDWVAVFGVLTLLGLVCVSSWMMWRISELTLPPAVSGFVSFIPVAGLLQLSVFGGGLLITMLLLVIFAKRRKLTFKQVFVGWCAVHVLSGVAYVAGFDTEVELPSAMDVASVVPSQEALKTGDQYRELDLLVSGPMPIPKVDDDERESAWEITRKIFEGTHEVSQDQWAWLDQNEEVVQELLANTKRPECAPDQIVAHWGFDLKHLRLGRENTVDLLRLSALKAETSGDLAQAWEYHLAMLRMQGHFLHHQPPVERTYNVRDICDYYQRDLKRWINNPAQTPELLMRAAGDFNAILAQTPRMSESIDLKYLAQISALTNHRLGSWVHDDVDVTAWPRFLFQALHSLPWESERGKYMLSDVYQQQKFVADAIESGEQRVYGPEIAAGRQPNDGYVSERAVWMWYTDSSETKEDEARWRLAETTPIFRGYAIEGFGTAPSQNFWMWQRELSWVKNRRLVLLQMAFRAAELDREEPVNSLERLVELRALPAVNAILEFGEESEAEKNWKDRSLRDDDPVEFQKYWFYVDPVRFRRFDMETIDKFRNPRVD